MGCGASGLDLLIRPRAVLVSVVAARSIQRDASSPAKIVRPLPLHAGRSTFGECFHFLELGHGNVARKRREQCAMGPAQAQGLFRGPSGNEAVDESRGKAVAAADAVDDVELTNWADVALTVERTLMDVIGRLLRK